MNRLATRESKNSPKPTWNALVYYHEVRDPTVVIQGLQGLKKWPAFHVLCSNTVNLNLVLVSTKTPFWCLSPLAALTKSRSIHELFPDQLHLNGIAIPVLTLGGGYWFPYSLEVILSHFSWFNFILESSQMVAPYIRGISVGRRPYQVLLPPDNSQGHWSTQPLHREKSAMAGVSNPFWFNSTLACH